MEFKNLEQYLEQYAEESVNLMKDRLSGTQLASTLKVVDGTEGLPAIQMREYGIYVHSGRKPGKMPPIDALRGWASSRNIPEEALYPIAKKIGEEGTEAQPFLDVLHRDELVEVVYEGVEKDIYDALGI